MWARVYFAKLLTPLLDHCMFIQGISRLVDITARGDFLGLCDQKVHINMCPILDGYGVMGIFKFPYKPSCEPRLTEPAGG